MAPSPIRAALQQVRRLAVSSHDEERPDRQLLQDFVSRRDEAAFATLVRRHGSLVLRVCRQVAHQDQDAEDAFQATFLILARRASSIREGEALAGWLHRVAFHVASKARRAAARRRIHEARVQPSRPKDPTHELSWHEVQEVLHEEIQRLPETLRAPFVLCVLEDKSRSEAARQLGWHEGTVSSRLARARERLRRQLTRRGVVLSAVLAAVAIAGSEGRAAESALLVGSTVRAGLQFAAGSPAAVAAGSARVGSLVEGVTIPMLASKQKVAVVLLLAGILVAGTGLLIPAASQVPPGLTPEPPGRPVAAEVEKEKSPRLDRNGDPLPAGALFRFGSLRGRHDGTILASALSPDGKTLATTSGQSVVFWDLANNKPLRRFDTGEYWPFARPTLVFSPDGSRLGYVQSNSFGCVWDVSSGKEVARFARKSFADSHDYAICQFTPDGKEVVVAEGPKNLVFWDLEANREKRTVAVEHVCLLSPDARTCVRIEPPKFSLVFSDARTGKPTGRLDAVSLPGVQWDVAFAPDGKSIAVVDQRKEIQVRDFPGGGLRFSFPLPDSAKYKVRDKDYWESQIHFSADGKTLLLATHGGVAHRWDLATRKELPPLRGHVGPVSGIHPLPDGKTVITTGEEGLIRRWDAQTGKELSAPDGYASSLHSDYSPDGRLAAVGDSRGRLELWDVRQGRLVRTLLADGAAVARLVFTPDGKALAAALTDSTVHFWSVPDGKEQRVLRCGKEQDLSYTRVLQISPDGRRLLISDSRCRACVWDLAGEKVCWHASFVICAFSADGATVVGQWNDGWHVRDANTGRPCGKLALDHGVFGGFYALACSPDGRRIAAGDHDGTVYLCPTAPGGPVSQFKAADATRFVNDPVMGPVLLAVGGIGAPVHALAFSRDGRWLCTTGADGSLRVWEVATQAEVLRLPGHVVGTPALGEVSFGADSRTVLSCGSDAQAYLWTLRPPAADTEKTSLDSLWAALADEPKQAYRAIWQLSDAEGAAAFLRGKIPPVEPVADERLEKLIGDLDSNQFAVRQAASKALAELGELAVPAMRKALAGEPTLEPRRRLEALVERVETRKLTAGELRIQRAIAALEMQGTAAARQVLKGLAAGAPGALPTTAAQAALRRLGR
jgi:RNA polymerase sigma factor (sigma-70 family)